MGLLPTLTRLLGADSNVVHSYAAAVVEKLLAPQAPAPPLLARDDVAAHVPALLQVCPASRLASTTGVCNGPGRRTSLCCGLPGEIAQAHIGRNIQRSQHRAVCRLCCTKAALHPFKAV